MQKLKFRIWDKQNEAMYYSDNDALIFLCLDGQLCELNEKSRLVKVDDRDRYVVMQMLDLSNDKIEIFEGDFITRYDEMLNLTVISLVDDYVADSWSIRADGVEKYKVAGNIFENPELSEYIE